MIEYFRKEAKKDSIKKLNKFKKNCWIKVVNPTEEEISFLVENFKILKDNLIDGLDVDEIPRFDFEDSINYIFLRLPRYHSDSPTDSFLLVFGKDFFMTVSKEDLGIFGKLSVSSGFITKNNNRALLQFLSYISKSFGFSVNRIWKSVKKDRKNLIKLNSKNILDLVKQEDILNDYLFSFSSLIDVYTKVIKSRTISFGDDEKDFVEDLVVDLNQTFNSCKSALKTITNMRDYYSTTLSNNLNNTLKILTIFTVFLTIPTLLASIYGMNIPLPFQNSPVLVWVMIPIVIITWIIIFRFFKKLGILD